MFLQKVIAKQIRKKNIFFVGILEVTGEKSRIKILSRIRTNMSRIRNTVTEHICIQVLLRTGTGYLSNHSRIQVLLRTGRYLTNQSHIQVLLIQILNIMICQNPSWNFLIKHLIIVLPYQFSFFSVFYRQVSFFLYRTLFYFASSVAAQSQLGLNPSHDYCRFCIGCF